MLLSKRKPWLDAASQYPRSLNDSFNNSQAARVTIFSLSFRHQYCRVAVLQSSTSHCSYHSSFSHACATWPAYITHVVQQRVACAFYLTSSLMTQALGHMMQPNQPLFLLLILTAGPWRLSLTVFFREAFTDMSADFERTSLSPIQCFRLFVLSLCQI